MTIKELRKAWRINRLDNGWSLRDAAKACNVSASQICRFEKGSDLKLSTLLRMLDAIEMDLKLD